MADFDRLPRLGASAFDPTVGHKNRPETCAEANLRRSDTTFNRGLSFVLFTSRCLFCI